MARRASTGAQQALAGFAKLPGMNTASQRQSGWDSWITAFDHSLRTVLGVHPASQPCPGSGQSCELSPEEKALSGALMRVNHVGEVCAQALYRAQALSTRDAGLREHFEQAAQEEVNHLAWTQQRLQQLGARTSLLTPLWYGGAFAIGTAAGLAGDKISLGFVVETERQVEEHLAGHLQKLPTQDLASRAIVSQMQADEARHAQDAQAAGAVELPGWIKQGMRWAAGIMTRTAHHI